MQIASIKSISAKILTLLQHACIYTYSIHTGSLFINKHSRFSLIKKCMVHLHRLCVDFKHKWISRTSYKVMQNINSYSIYKRLTLMTGQYTGIFLTLRIRSVVNNNLKKKNFHSVKLIRYCHWNYWYKFYISIVGINTNAFTSSYICTHCLYIFGYISHMRRLSLANFRNTKSRVDTIHIILEKK